jgi:hypothetical protein
MRQHILRIYSFTGMEFYPHVHFKPVDNTNDLTIHNIRCIILSQTKGEKNESSKKSKNK